MHHEVGGRAGSGRRSTGSPPGSGCSRPRSLPRCAWPEPAAAAAGADRPVTVRRPWGPGSGAAALLHLLTSRRAVGRLPHGTRRRRRPSRARCWLPHGPGPGRVHHQPNHSALVAYRSAAGIFLFFRLRLSTPSSGSAAAAVPERAQCPSGREL